eukprot:SAG31_NODE_663_length_13021_cov_9.408296_3_plen_96_part_00
MLRSVLMLHALLLPALVRPSAAVVNCTAGLEGNLCCSLNGVLDVNGDCVCDPPVRNATLLLLYLVYIASFNSSGSATVLSAYGRAVQADVSKWKT